MKRITTFLILMLMVGITGSAFAETKTYRATMIFGPTGQYPFAGGGTVGSLATDSNGYLTSGPAGGIYELAVALPLLESAQSVTFNWKFEGQVNVEAKVNDASTYTDVYNGIPLTFSGTNKGTNLKWRATFVGKSKLKELTVVYRSYMSWVSSEGGDYTFAGNGTIVGTKVDPGTGNLVYDTGTTHTWTLINPVKTRGKILGCAFATKKTGGGTVTLKYSVDGTNFYALETDGTMIFPNPQITTLPNQLYWQVTLTSGAILSEVDLAYSETDTPFAFGNKDLSGFKYRKLINFTNSGDAVYGFQKRIKVGESQNATGEDVFCGIGGADTKIRSAFNDVRFTAADGVTPLSYYFRSNITGSPPSRLAEFIVNVPYVAASAQDPVWMYYGKDSAVTTSSYADTFALSDPSDLILGLDGNASTNELYIGMNDGSGYFNFATSNQYNVSNNADVTAIAAADFDLDGDIDFVIATVEADEPLFLYENDGSGLFTSHDLGYQYLSYGIKDLMVVDVNGDGYPDFVATSYTKHYVFINQKDNTFFRDPTKVIDGTLQYRGAAADFDNDGDEDLVLEVNNTFYMQLFLNGTTGTRSGTFVYQSGKDFSMGARSDSIVAADFDNDGDFDLMAVRDNKDVVYFMNNWNPKDSTHTLGFTYVKQVVSGLAVAYNAITAGDFNGDGLMDFAIGRGYSADPYELIIYTQTADASGNPSGNFVQLAGYQLPKTIFKLAAGDLRSNKYAVDTLTMTPDAEQPSRVLGFSDTRTDASGNIALDSGKTSGYYIYTDPADASNPSFPNNIYAVKADWVETGSLVNSIAVAMSPNWAQVTKNAVLFDGGDLGVGGSKYLHWKTALDSGESLRQLKIKNYFGNLKIKTPTSPFTVGTDNTIQWNVDGLEHGITPLITLQYSLNSSTSWTDVPGAVKIVNTGSFVWPTSVLATSGATAKLKIIDAQNPDNYQAGMNETGTFAINPGAPAEINITQQPTNAKAGAGITPAIAIQLRDAGHNPCTNNSTATVTIAIDNNPGTATLSGTLTKTVTAGVATFDGLSLNRPGTGYTLKLTSNAISNYSVSTAGFNITPGDPASINIAQQPTNAKSGVAITPAITAQLLDSSSNVCTNSTATVSIAINNNAGGGTLAGTTSKAAVAGVATFSGLSINKIGTGYTLKISSAGLSDVTTSAFNITPGNPASMVITQQPAVGASIPAGGLVTPAIKIELRDANQNVCTDNSTATVSMAFGANPGTGILSGTASRTVSAGVVTFNDLSINKTGTGYTLKASSTGLSDVTTNSFNITPAAFSSFTITAPNSAVAGVPFGNVVVTAKDTLGNDKTDYDGNIYFTSSPVTTPPAVLPYTSTSAYHLVGAAHTFALPAEGFTLKKAVPQTITVTDGTKSGVSGTITVTAGVPVSLAITQQPVANANILAGATISPNIKVELRDANQNICTTSSANVAVAINNNPGTGTLSGTASKAATAGVALFDNLSINKSGTGYTLRATSTGLTAADSNAFNINPAAAYKFVITGPATLSAGATTGNTITITAQDFYGNINNAGPNLYSDSHTLIFSGASAAPNGTIPQIGGADIGQNTVLNFSNGVVTAPALLYKAENAVIAAQEGAINTTGADRLAVRVDPAALSKLEFTDGPKLVVSGVWTSYAIQRKDTFDNPITASDLSVGLSSEGSSSGRFSSGCSDATVINAITIASGSSLGDFCYMDTNAGNYKLKTTAGTVSQGYDITVLSAGVFIISPNPTTPEVWIAGDNKTITWTSSGLDPSPVRVLMSPDGADNNYSEISGDVSSADGSHSFDWAVPNNFVSSDNVKFKVKSTRANSPPESTPVQVRIRPRFNITSPASGSYINVGSQPTITWSTVNGATTKVRIELFNGSGWQDIVASTDNDGSYSPADDGSPWIVPDNITASAQIRISDAVAGHVVDSSLYETIPVKIRGVLTIDTPDTSAAEWVAREPGRSIGWHALGSVGPVKISFAVPPYTTWYTFLTNIASGGSGTAVKDSTLSLTEVPDAVAKAFANFTTSDKLIADTKIKIEAMSDANVNAVSDLFKIKYYQVQWRIKDLDSLSDLAGLSANENRSGIMSWMEMGLNSATGIYRNYAHGNYSTTWSYGDPNNPPQNNPYPVPATDDNGGEGWPANKDQVRTIYLESAASQNISYQISLAYAYDPDNNNVTFKTWLQRRGVLIEGKKNNEGQEIAFGGVELTVYDGANPISPTLTATADQHNQGAFELLWNTAGQTLDPTKVYFVKSTIRYNSKPYTSGGTFQVSTVESALQDIKTDTAKIGDIVVPAITQTIPQAITEATSTIQTKITDAQSAVEAKVDATKDETKAAVATAQSAIQADVAGVKADTSKILVSTETIPGQLANVQAAIQQSVTTEGSQTRQLVESKATEVTQKVDTVGGKISSIDDLKGEIAAMYSQFSMLQNALGQIEKSMPAGTTTVGAGQSDNMSAVFQQLTNLSKQIKKMNVTRGSDVDKLLAVEKGKSGDILYLKNKVTELKSLMEISQQLIDNVASPPTSRTWYEWENK